MTGEKTLRLAVNGGGTLFRECSSSASLQDWRYETDSAGSMVIGRGVQKWAVHFKMRYDAALQQLEVGLLRVSTIAGSTKYSLFWALETCFGH